MMQCRIHICVDALEFFCFQSYKQAVDDVNNSATKLSIMLLNTNFYYYINQSILKI